MMHEISGICFYQRLSGDSPEAAQIFDQRGLCSDDTLNLIDADVSAF
jgi:hypothetical protein